MEIMVIMNPENFIAQPDVCTQLSVGFISRCDGLSFAVWIHRSTREKNTE